MARATSDRPRARWVFLRGAEEVFGGEELLRSLLEAAPATILATTPAGRLLFINRLFTRTSEALEGRTIYDFTAPRHHADIRVCLERVAATGEPGSYETEGQSATGAPAWYESRVAPLFKDGRIAALTIVATDVTARRAAEERLRESEEKLRVAVAATDMGLWSWDAERDAYSWDARMLEIFGLERPPRSVAEYAALVHPDDRDRLNERVAATRGGRSFEPTEYRIRRGDGTLRWVQVRGRVMGDGSGVGKKVMGGTLDVTERRALDERMRQSQKLEAVGQLTAGIAHNFNNLLMVILPNLELTPLVPPEERLSLVEDARQAAERAAELVRQLVVFAGKDAPAAYAVKDVAPLVERTVAICRGTFDRQTSVEARVAGALPLVSMDAGQIEQALLNVCLNARDAMSDRAVRRLLVEVAALAARAPELGRHGVDADRAWVCIRVTDTGHGMDEATRRRLFEPFFTTKPPGKGTGLGLASVYAVMKAHGGWIDVDSTPNVGTTLSLFLPAAEQGSPAVQGPAERREPAAGQHVLVVDDEPLVREVVARVLEDGGYRVSLAAGAREALEVFERTPEGFALVLLDLSMPDGSGRDVCRAMKTRRPRQPVVYFSGYPLDEASEADGVVEKPVGADALLAAVDRALGKA